MSLRIQLECQDATWGELRALMKIADEQGLSDDEQVPTWCYPFNDDFAGFEIQIGTS